MLDLDSVIDLCATLVEDRRIQATVKYSVASGVFIGAVSVVGGLLAGPPGLAIGSSAAGAASYLATRNKFESLGSIIRQMDAQQKQLLYDDVMAILQNFSITDIVTLQQAITGDDQMRSQLVTSIVDSMQNRMSIELRE